MMNHDGINQAAAAMSDEEQLRYVMSHGWDYTGFGFVSDARAGRRPGGRAWRRRRNQHVVRRVQPAHRCTRNHGP